MNPDPLELARHFREMSDESCLEASGIPAMVADANLVQMNSLWTVAVGGVRIRVPASRVIEAREVLAAYNRGDFALPDD